MVHDLHVSPTSIALGVALLLLGASLGTDALLAGIRDDRQHDLERRGAEVRSLRAKIVALRSAERRALEQRARLQAQTSPACRRWPTCRRHLLRLLQESGIEIQAFETAPTVGIDGRIRVRWRGDYQRGRDLLGALVARRNLVRLEQLRLTRIGTSEHAVPSVEIDVSVGWAARARRRPSA